MVSFCFFHVKNKVYVSPTVQELQERIAAAVRDIDKNMLVNLWTELDYHLDMWRGSVTVELPKLVIPAYFTLKPFAGIYNPFPYGCSVLCNHPADFEAKSVVKKGKDAWTTDRKSLMNLEEFSIMRRQKEKKPEPQTLLLKEETNNDVPEELFRKYTNTDSRPVTPAPTLASVITKNLRIRRCMTPDPTSFTPTKEKTSLVLDLRRSHSQETVCWLGGLFDNFSFEQKPISKSVCPSSLSTTQSEKKKLQKKKACPPSATVSNLKTQSSKDSDLKAQHSFVSQSPSKESAFQKYETFSKNPEHFSENNSENLNIVKRRGKNTKKGKKSGKGEKEFQGIPEPGETQVSALENDSLEGSSRQSLTEEDKFSEKHIEKCHVNREAKVEEEETNTSFLSRDTLKTLQRQLDQEIVDSELNAKRKIALQEALKHKKNPKYVQQGEEMRTLKTEFQLLIKDSEKWLSIPRIYTRRSSRFELPMDSRVLNNLTPMQYIQKYVFPSPERLVLYNHVFNLYKEEPEDDEEKERIILGQKITEALEKVMGRPMTIKERNEFRNLLIWKDEASIDFRTFTGICATCERLISSQQCSKISDEDDPRHEIEKADFETLDEKLLRLSPDPKLVKILKSIRDM